MMYKFVLGTRTKDRGRPPSHTINIRSPLDLFWLLFLHKDDILFHASNCKRTALSATGPTYVSWSCAQTHPSLLDLLRLLSRLLTLILVDFLSLFFSQISLIFPLSFKQIYSPFPPLSPSPFSSPLFPIPSSTHPPQNLQSPISF